MSYYISEVDNSFKGTRLYRVVKRLKDFKGNPGVEYMVFRSKKAMKEDMFVDLYTCGFSGKLRKLKNRSMMRF